MSLTRLPGWQSRLRRYLGEAAQKPFSLGRHDCFLFAAGGVEALTGFDPAAPCRGRYRTLIGGLRLARRHGYADQSAYLAELLPQSPVLTVMPGDLAEVATPEGPAMGIVQGSSIYVLRPEAGLHLVPRSAASRFLTVGAR